MLTEKNGLYIFEGLTQKEIAYFIMMSETLHFSKGATIMSEGDVSDNRAYLIESGSVDIYRQGMKIATLHEGDIFGEMALITNEPRSASVVSHADTEVLAFGKDEFLMLYKQSGLYEDIKRKIFMRVKGNFYDDKE
ncbi:MAG: cyclic nucleotide-binding domain-containing protein [Candidatus Gracilibacteria bacterium]|nr:cyclic nucleotide-binding domain-containing protein [Candidatus Gracilibacteria bacterium]